MLGLAVNVASVLLLSGGEHDHDHNHRHGHGIHDHAHEAAHGHEASENHLRGAAHRDNNLRSAIIHVLADAAVSLLVIAGLLLGRLFGWNWLDPVVGSSARW